MSNLSIVKSEIMQAVRDIHAANRSATRKAVAERTGKTFAVVDDHLKNLKDEGVIRAVVPGVFEPREVFEPNRPVSKTVLAEGWVKVEVGDQELTLTPGEARVVGLALYGDAMEFAHIKGEREVYDTVQTLRASVRSAEKRLTDMAKEMARMEQQRRQEDLFATT